MKSYKHSVGLTSQVFFCSTPLRLDSYNRCEFGCVYCFSRLRGIKNSSRGVRAHNVNAFRRRLNRVQSGEVHSALDEFLQRRVPIQFGGMQDPFTAMERREGVTSETLRVLETHDYPVLISTKSALVSEPDYLDLLRPMNVSVRLSAAGVHEGLRGAIERDVPSFSETLRTIETLSAAGIPVTLRIQPIIPGQEEHVFPMMRRAADAGARHVSLEFLKLPIESRSGVMEEISAIVGYSLRSFFEARGVLRIGPDFTLATAHKIAFLKAAQSVAQGSRISIGAGDTELIHLSDGDGCCNGSSLFLRGNVFNSNFTGMLKGLRQGDLISFADVTDKWSPNRPVSTYLMTDSTASSVEPGLTEWQSLMAKRWEKGRSPYSPTFFAGVKNSGIRDENGRSVYSYDDPLADT